MHIVLSEGPVVLHDWQNVKRAARIPVGIRAAGGLVLSQHFATGMH